MDFVMNITGEKVIVDFFKELVVCISCCSSTTIILILLLESVNNLQDHFIKKWGINLQMKYLFPIT